MKTEIRIPSMGESISEVIIGHPFVVSGSYVKVDAEILELETDKVNQVLYAPEEGVVTLSVKTGDVVQIGQVIGFIDSKTGELPLKKEDRAPAIEKASAETVEISPGIPEIKKSQVDEIRKTKESIVLELSQVEEPRLVGKESVSTTKNPQRETRRPMSKIRKVIAHRLVEAQHSAAMLTTFNEVDLSQVIQMREKYKELFEKKFGTKLGFMSFFVKAVVSALKSFPNVNSYIDKEDIVHREYFDIGIAVGSDRGIVVPVLRNCDLLSVADIDLAIDGYAEKAKTGRIALEDLEGGGFTITNGGIYGSLLSTPILNPPQCGILGMHKIEKRPVVVNDQIVIRPMMYLALSYDHRLIDGKESVSFLMHIKNMLEDPSRFYLNI